MKPHIRTLRLIPMAILLAMGCVSSVAMAQATTEPVAEAADVRRGSFNVSLTESSPLSDLNSQNQRYHIAIAPIQRYKLMDHTYQAYVPEDYDPHAEPYGLMVWVNSGANGSIPRGWSDVLKAHRLIGIGANDSGNDQGVAVRFGLALDAVHNLKKQYHVDETRIYASGVSGGGKIAGMLATCYPEVFQGAVCIVGVAFYRDIAITGQANKMWQRSFDRPSNAIIDRARKSRFVLITGPLDGNHDPMLDFMNKGFLPDGFKYMTFVDIPGQGHSVPADPKWIDQAIDTLDAPLKDLAQPMKAENVLAIPEQKASTPASPVLAAPTSRPTVATDSESEAQRLYTMAENYENNNLHTQARERLEKIIKEYPATKAAARAKTLLDRINKEQHR